MRRQRVLHRAIRARVTEEQVMIIKRIAPRKAITAVTAVAVASIGVGGVAAAYTPGGANTIKGCYATKGGAMRVVKSSAHCPKGTRTLQWNVKGRAGSPGKTGRTGRTGSRGATGATGARGPQGPGAISFTYQRDALDFAPATLATYRGYKLLAVCNYDAAKGQATAALNVQAPAGTSNDLLGHLTLTDATSNSTVTETNIHHYDLDVGTDSGPIYLGGSSSFNFRPHTTATYAPFSVRGESLGSVITFDVAATLTTNSGASVDAAEGRCRIDGSLTPTTDQSG